MSLIALYDTFEELDSSTGHYLKFYDTAASSTGYNPNGRLNVYGAPMDCVRAGITIPDGTIRAWLAQSASKPVKAGQYPWKAVVFMSKGRIKRVVKS